MVIVTLQRDATKGDDCTFKLPFRIRMSDKLYKIVEA
jgi:putative protease